MIIPYIARRHAKPVQESNEAPERRGERRILRGEKAIPKFPPLTTQGNRGQSKSQ